MRSVVTVEMTSLLPKVVLIPGNGCTHIEASNWYLYMQQQLQASKLFSEVKMHNMPDPFEAKRELWLPFIKEELIHPHDSSNTIVVGHSSGAVASMRLLEDTELLGCVLVSACHSDLGEQNEKISGYYPGYKEGKEDPNPWLFHKMKENSKWILQYHSSDDPFIPRAEADFVAAAIGSEYTCYDDKSHFFNDQDVVPIIEDIKKKVMHSAVGL